MAESKNVTLRKIEIAAVSGALAKHRRLAVLLGVWRKWGKSEDVSDYVAALTEKEVGTLQLLRSLVVRSLSHGTGDYIATERYYMRRKDIETLISMDSLDAKLRQLRTDGLTEEDRRAVEAFQKAIGRRNAGKPDDDPFARD